MSGFNRRDVVAFLGALLARRTSSAADRTTESHWPSGPVRIVSPLGPGGPNDVSARIIAERLSQRFAVPFLVDNRPGAGTRIGNEVVVRAPHDGATLLYAAAALSVLPSLYALPYDWRRDLVPVSLAVQAPLFLVIDATLPITNVSEFVTYAKARPNGLIFAAPGVATIPHLVSELLLRKLGVPGLIVHFRGDAAAYTELLAGRVDAIVSVPTAALAYLRGKRLRMLGVAAEERASLFPDVPTLAEQGIAGVNGSAWFGFLAPARTAAGVIAAIHEAVTAALSEPSVKHRLLELGLEPVGSRPEEFATFIDREALRWSDIVSQAHIKGE